MAGVPRQQHVWNYVFAYVDENHNDLRDRDTVEFTIAFDADPREELERHRPGLMEQWQKLSYPKIIAKSYSCRAVGVNEGDKPRQ